MPGGPTPTLRREQAAWAEGRLLIGVDEVGRGPLAGPVLAAAVVFPPNLRRVRGVRDSKVLSAARRAVLLPRLQSSAMAVAVGAASVREIDRYNIRKATALAMRRAVLRLLPCCPVSPAPIILVDGLPFPELGLEHQALVDGDARCYSIAVAGIIAKQVRDRLMDRLSPRYPGYGWDHNAGYATADHCSALDLLGPTPHHRRSFVPTVQIRLAL